MPVATVGRRAPDWPCCRPSASPGRRRARTGRPAPLGALLVAVVAAVGVLVGGVCGPCCPAAPCAPVPGSRRPVALRGLLAGSFFGVEAIIPLALSVQHRLQRRRGRPAADRRRARPGPSGRGGRAAPARRTPRSGGPDCCGPGSPLITVAALGVALALARGVPAVARSTRPGPWPESVPAWPCRARASCCCEYTSDADRGADSAALQLADATCSAVTTGATGVLVAAAVRGAIGYATAFSPSGRSPWPSSPRSGAVALGPRARNRVAPAVKLGAAMPYLDHAATTPMLPEAIAAVRPPWVSVGNPSSLHGVGRAGPAPGRGVARAARRRARRPAVRGRVHRRRHRGRQPRRQGHLLGPPRRRPAPPPGAGQRGRAPRRARRRASGWPTHEGAEVDWLPVDATGRVAPGRRCARRSADDPDAVALVSVMWANNEVGTVAADRRAGRGRARVRRPAAHRRGAGRRARCRSTSPPAACDALTMTGHKLGGPIGAGALLLRRDVACVPLLHGGGQERDVRSGTLDVPGGRRPGRGRDRSPSSGSREHAARLAALRDDLVAGVRDAGRRTSIVNGDPTATALPGIAHLSLPRLRGRLAADAARRPRRRVLDRLGLLGRRRPALARPAGDGRVDAAQARGSLRFSLGHTSTAEDVVDGRSTAHRAGGRAGPPRRASPRSPVHDQAAASWPR